MRLAFALSFHLLAFNVASAQSAGELPAKTFAQFLMLVEDDLGTKELGESEEQIRSYASQNSDTVTATDADATGMGVAGQQPSSPDLDSQQLGTERSSDQTLRLSDVVASLYQSYPEIMQARQETGIAAGQMLSANGAYDTKFKAHALTEPTGYYENYRWGLGLARQTWWGGSATAGYRIGRGSFQPWYKERQTDDAGEFKLGLIQPLLQGRAIDPQRVAFFKASLDQQTPGPIVLQTLLKASQEAAKLYWQWVSAGNVLEAQKQLLLLSEKRGEQFEVGVRAGKFPEIDLILNQQLIAERRAQTLEAEQKFKQVAFKLSLYLRDASGQPMVAAQSWLPNQFPAVDQRLERDFQSDLIAALSRRPELQLLQIYRRQLQLDRQLACNQMLPNLDLITEASQDMGEPATKSDDKGQFELVFGITSEVPIQRRKARGKLQSTAAKMAQTDQKLRLVRDKIAVEIKAANNQLEMSSKVVQQTKLSLDAAFDTLERYRFAFQKGKIDLIYLNLLETKTNETQIKLVKAQENWFAALADLQSALGLDPLEQAITVSALSSSNAVDSSELPELEQTEVTETQ